MTFYKNLSQEQDYFLYFHSKIKLFIKNVLTYTTFILKLIKEYKSSLDFQSTFIKLFIFSMTHMRVLIH